MTLGSHQQTIGRSQVHLTPRFILDALGPFDLDPCAATVRPWDCATRNYVEAEDGLSLPWSGRVWLNPPFDSRVAGRWVSRLAEHGDGVLLIHARTETRWFSVVWEHASAILFLGKRVKFCRPDGEVQPWCSGAPVVLAAFGKRNAEVLATCGLSGVLVNEWRSQAPSPACAAALEAEGRGRAAGLFDMLEAVE